MMTKPRIVSEPRGDAGDATFIDRVKENCENVFLLVRVGSA
jgi:hypothetical protein